MCMKVRKRGLTACVNMYVQEQHAGLVSNALLSSRSAMDAAILVDRLLEVAEKNPQVL